MDKNIKKWLDKNFDGDIENKNIVITGANSGIGFEVALLCAHYNAHIIMAIRNLERGEKAKQKILDIYPNCKIDIMIMDLSSFDSIKHFVNELTTHKIDVDAFYHNAGVFRIPNKVTKDGFELIMGTNYIGTYYLNELLMPYFESLNKEVRVIFTTSISKKMVKLNYEDFFSEKKYNSLKVYGRSKLAVTHYYLYLLDKYKASKVKILLVHPGVTYTTLINKAYNKVFAKIAEGFMKLFFHKTSKAALSTMYLLKKDISTGTFSGPRG